MNNKKIIGFVHPASDVHTLGIFYASELLESVGVKTIICDEKISNAVERLNAIKYLNIFKNWLLKNKISEIGFSYRLDAQTAQTLFGNFFSVLKKNKLLFEQGGIIKKIYFAGLPEANEKLQKEYKGRIIIFWGDESPIETLTKFGIKKEINNISGISSKYDEEKRKLAKEIIDKGNYYDLSPNEYPNYADFGSKKDTVIKRILDAKERKILPIIRTHAGPYKNNSIEALKEFNNWVKELSNGKFLDVLSIGVSQLTQSNFGENWEGLNNGGGVPINNEYELIEIWNNSRPMLLRSYAGTKNILAMAKIYERTINIAWHAFSLWWFSEIDGRGNNTVLENIKEHYEAIKFAARTNKPYEPNIPHHFVFRGADDISYVLSGILAVRLAKKLGIKTIILQTMLNTPKITSGINDLAKIRAYYRLAKRYEDKNFKVFLQPRAGLDYFSHNLTKAKIQLAETTILSDDIVPLNNDIPEIMHVVNYSEASFLANPKVIEESIKIVRTTFNEYRKLKKRNILLTKDFEKEIQTREMEIIENVTKTLKILEKHYENLFSPQKLYEIFRDGIFPLPYLAYEKEKYKNAIKWKTKFIKGGIKIVNELGREINYVNRVKEIIESKSL